MLPSVAHIYAVPFSSSADEDSDDDGGDGGSDGITAAVARKHGEFTWEDVYGFDMSAMAEYERHASRCRDAEILPLAAHHQMALRSSLLHTIDCHTISIEQCKEFHARFSCQFIVSEQLAGLALWFEVVFHPSGIVLSTSPDLEYVALPTRDEAMITACIALTRAFIMQDPRTGVRRYYGSRNRSKLPKMSLSRSSSPSRCLAIMLEHSTSR